jgi:hypothetical protein
LPERDFCWNADVVGSVVRRIDNGLAENAGLVGEVDVDVDTWTLGDKIFCWTDPHLGYTFREYS